jgi:poly(3-hydroxybutyrate) depolymerase
MPAPPLPMPTTHGRYVPFQVMTTGATLAEPQPAQAAVRSFWVRVPADYDPNKAYRTVFQTGSCGAPAANTALPLYDTSLGGSDEAIYVAIDPGGNPTTPACYDMSSGLESREYEAFALIHDAVAARFCVDEDRVFVASLGDSVSDQLGCFFGGGPDASRPFGRALHVRGQVLSDGLGEPPMLPRCKGPVAAIWFDNSQVQPQTRLSAASFARLEAQNGCTGTMTTPFSPTFPACQAATGCPTGFPVVLCSIVFGRTDHIAEQVAVFETFIEQVESAPAP